MRSKARDIYNCLVPGGFEQKNLIVFRLTKPREIIRDDQVQNAF